MMPDGISCLFCTDPFTMTCGLRIVPWRQDVLVTDSVPKRQIFLLGLARVRVYGRFCSFFQDSYTSLTVYGRSRTRSQVRSCMSVIVVSLVPHLFYWPCLFRWSCSPFRLLGFQRESRAWAVMAVRNTS